MRILDLPAAGPTRAADDLAELRLDDRVALVTGAAGGIGAATAELLGRRGAMVAVVDTAADRLATVGRQLLEAGVAVLAIVADVTDPKQCDAAVEACVDRWGRLDILVNSAGIGGGSHPVTEMPDEAWHAVFDVNIHGTFYTCRAAARRMAAQGSGRIVNVASIAGLEGNPNAAHYSASKAAVIALTKSLGKELAQAGVHVTAIAPAVIETDLLAQVGPAHVEYMRSKIPMGRFGRVEEVARLIAHLAGPHLTFSTGAVYDLSGGRATY
jgi:3-oxoacyl-[acyl-carrier protein] reductase